jgi:geranyl-CoA carboxylase alpha subunit
MPQSGTMRRWTVPADLRVDHALEAGSVVPPYYDSMIAKAVAHGATREEARRKLARGVSDLVALGITTNQEFLVRVLSHPVFAAGEATTAFVGQHEAGLLAVDDAVRRRAALIAAWLLHETDGQAQHRATRRLTHALPIGMRMLVDGAEVSPRVSQLESHRFAIELDGERHELDSVSIDDAQARFIVDGLMETVAYERDGALLWLHYAGRPHAVEDRTRAAGERRTDAAGDGKVRASMNGRVVAVAVKVGDRIASGQPVATLEAMKMEHVHMAAVSGTVTAVYVSEGEQVAASRVIAEIQPDAAAPVDK